MVVAHCKDCRAEGIKTWRAARWPGPRCAFHWNVEKRRRRLAAAGRRVQASFGITPEQYDKLYKAQDSRCAICQRAKGTGARRLAVDHDHALALRDGHPHEKGCPLCVRGLLCGPCNDMLAHAHDDPGMFYRAIRYLREPPSMRAGI